MQNVFMTNIHIEKVRHLQNMDILISNTERKHLILTGKNGSGKTSLLEALRDSVLYEQLGILQNGTKLVRNEIFQKPDINILFSQNILNYSDVMFVFIPAERSTFAIPKSIETVNIDEKTKVTRNASKDFLRYILSLDYQLYGAQTNNDETLEKKLQKWFDSFEAALRNIYNCQDLVLQRDTKNLAFKIEMPNREAFALNEMAAGYAAVLDTYMELIMRFESSENVVDYSTPAIVMIDEIETHLHVELQKRVLPFLTQMFPNVQFIVSTHSPFVISSLENVVLFDLEKNRRVENLSEYSWETIVESYFDINQYSLAVEKKFDRYKELYKLDVRNRVDEKEFSSLRAELSLVSPIQKELYLAFQQMEAQRKAAKNSG